MSDKNGAMTKAKGVHPQDVPQRAFQGQQIRQVTALGGELDEGGKVVLVFLDAGDSDVHPMAYALSPPDAHYLSKKLRRAVKAYLQSTADSGTE